jgi:hypothetical protein
VNKLLVKAILEAAPAFKWQIQGLGMLRLYLSKAVRLHVWHSGFASPGVSTLHTHPWDFESTVVAGQLENIRYKETTGTANTELDTERFYSSLLHCGPGGGLKEDPQLVYLKQLPSEIYHEGESYTEKAEEIQTGRRPRAGLLAGGDSMGFGHPSRRDRGGGLCHHAVRAPTLVQAMTTIFV